MTPHVTLLTTLVANLLAATAEQVVTLVTVLALLLIARISLDITQIVQARQDPLQGPLGRRPQAMIAPMQLDITQIVQIRQDLETLGLRQDLVKIVVAPQATQPAPQVVAVTLVTAPALLALLIQDMSAGVAMTAASTIIPRK